MSAKNPAEMPKLQRGSRPVQGDVQQEVQRSSCRDLGPEKKKRADTRRRISIMGCCATTGITTFLMQPAEQTLGVARKWIKKVRAHYVPKQRACKTKPKTKRSDHMHAYGACSKSKGGAVHRAKGFTTSEKGVADGSEYRSGNADGRRPATRRKRKLFAALIRWGTTEIGPNEAKKNAQRENFTLGKHGQTRKSFLGTAKGWDGREQDSRNRK